MITPYIWQRQSVEDLVRILSAGQFALNTSDTGTGKTIVALESIKRLQLPALIVCPKQVHTAWLQTADEMDCTKQIFGVVNAERLQFKNQFFRDKQWRIPPETLIVWDEVHRGASGPKSNTSKILAYTKPQQLKVLAMSATIASSPLQMRALGYLAGLHSYSDASYWPWCISNGCFKRPYINGLFFPKGTRGVELMANIGAQLQPMMTRIQIDQVPGFPETRILANLYDLDKDYLSLVKDAYRHMANQISSAKGTPRVERLRARQVTELAKVDLFKDLALDDHRNGKSVVVFVNFRESLARIAASLRMHLDDNLVAVIKDGQTMEERKNIVDNFRNDIVQVLVCMSQIGGVGINLHGAPGRRLRTSWLSPGDRADEFKQCLGRIHRAGGSYTVQTLVLAAGTVEEAVHKNLRGKLANMSALTDGDFSL